MSDSEIDFTEFKKILKDFIKDLLITFPDKLTNYLDDNLRLVITDDDTDGEAIRNIYKYCKTVYPERFFDILYQNKKMFENENIKTEFLPSIEFKDLWKEDLTDKTREAIWKYLQLILFLVVTNVDDNHSFGNTAKLFESIDQNAFKDKLEDTIKQMHGVFQNMEGPNGAECAEGAEGAEGAGGNPFNFNFNDMSGINMDNLPNADDIQSHINKLMGGKLGQLAQELAEDTAANLNLDTSNISSVDDVFKKLLNDPTKLMKIVKNVGSKLDEKMKSGDIKESELLEEANDLVNNMKNMPGMDNIEKMFGNLGNMKHKFNANMFQDMMDKNIKSSKNKERMRSKLAKNLEESRIANETSEEDKDLDNITDLDTLNKNLNTLLENLQSSDNSGEKPKKDKNKNNKKKNRTGMKK